VKAFVKHAGSGRQVPVGTLKEGAFFGEVSMLTGRPRSASVVAATYCELLELDRATLDSIVATHPHVLEVMKEFARRRSRASEASE
jgi:CRP-like cAMP-binding protein